MKIKHTLGLSLCAVGLLLSGCASTTPKSADVLARAALENQLLEQGFNFTASARISDFKLQDSGEAAALGSLLGSLTGRDLPENEAGSEAKPANPIMDIGLDAIRAFRFEANGAVDFASKRIEIAPTLRFSRRNLESAISLPLLADGREMAIYFDASAFDWVVPGLRERQGQLIRLAGNDLVKKLDTDRLLQDMRLAAKEAYGAIRNDSFSLVALSEADQREGVAYKVRLQLDPAQEQEFTSRWIDSLARAAQTQYALLYPGQDASTVQGMGLMLKALLAGSRTNIDSLLLIDRQGRLIGTESDTQVEQGKTSLRIHNSARLSHFGQPQFNLQPQAGQFYDAEELQRIFGKKSPEVASTTADEAAALAAADASSAAERAAAEAEQAAAAKPKTKAKKKSRKSTASQ